MIATNPAPGAATKTANARTARGARDGSRCWAIYWGVAATTEQRSSRTGSFRAVVHSPERHRAHRAGWLRAAVLGADDGIVSTASLMLGVTASHATRSAVLTAGLAGLAAGAMAMAAGEYVSVASQRDTERADLERERRELASVPGAELDELTGLYIGRGVEAGLARQVAAQLSAHDALGVHAREELGLTETTMARPVQAGVSSAAAFAIVPVLVLLVSPPPARAAAIVAVALIALGLIGRLGAAVGGADWRRATARVVAGGAPAMAVTAAVGRLAGVAGI
jgi:vacuolar iron transporter family protein